MKYCPTCGEEIVQESRFCPNCGVAISYSQLKDVEEDDKNEEDKEIVQEKTIFRANKEATQIQAIGVLIITIMWISVAMTVILALLDIRMSPSFLVAEFLHLHGNTLARLVVCSTPIVWIIPMTLMAVKRIESGKKFTNIFAILTLIFVNMIAGILMFAFNSETKHKLEK